LNTSNGFSPGAPVPGHGFFLKGSPALLTDSRPVLQLFPRFFSLEESETAPEDTTVFLTGYDSRLPREGYRISSEGPALRVEAGEMPGLLYGLLDLIRYSIEDKISQPQDFSLEEQPAHAYRGFMLDSARHFFKAPEILRILDLCLILKLNRFHWHLTDDQGWRIESKVHPALHETGSRRKPFRGDHDSCTGYFTREEMARVVSYAAERGITVIPEIDMPGHVSALLAAYPRLSCRGKKKAVPRRPGIYSDVLCPGREEVFRFMDDILEEISSLFPGPWIHLGGDEVPPHRWRHCPRCRALMARHNLKSESELQGYFMNRMIHKAAALGKEAVVWNYAATPVSSSEKVQLDRRGVIQFWREKGGARRSRRAFEKGQRMIFSDFWHLYLDYPHGMTSLKKTQGYAPGFPTENDEKTAAPLGMEAPLWTEYVTTPEKLYRMILPRLYAMAETAWTGKTNPYYGGFLERIRILDSLCRELGYQGTPLDQADPGPVSSFFQVSRFVLTALSRIRL